MALLTPFRSLKSLSLFAIVGLALMILTDLLSIVIGVGQVISPDTSLDLDEGEVVSIWLLVQGLVYLLRFPVYTFTVVMFLVWLHRAHTNLGALQASNLQFTSGWAVGWWFIPFANLIKPFQVVREVWSESDPDIGPQDRVFLSASLQSAPTYMGFWWGMWIVSNIAANITARVYEPDSMGYVGVVGMLFIVTGILSAIAAALAIMVVKDITARQDQRFAAISSRVRYTDVPPPPPTFDRDL